MSNDHTHPCAAHCGRPADGAFLCRWCTDELSLALAGVAELARELITAVTRLARLGDTVVVSSQGPPPLPYDPGAADAQATLHNTLSTWTRDLAERGGYELPGDDDRDLAMWLRTQLEVIRIHPAAAEIADELHHAINHGWRVVDRPPGRAYVGPCGAEIEGKPCSVDLYARVDPTRPDRLDSRQSVLTCPACGTQWQVDKRREWLIDRLRGTLATPREIAAAGTIAGCTVNTKTIRTWAQRRLIMSYSNPTGGQVRHEIGEVIDRATMIAAKAARRAGQAPRRSV